jgi:hypothetical protein
LDSRTGKKDAGRSGEQGSEGTKGRDVETSGGSETLN